MFTPEDKNKHRQDYSDFGYGYEDMRRRSRRTARKRAGTGFLVFLLLAATCVGITYLVWESRGNELLFSDGTQTESSGPSTHSAGGEYSMPISGTPKDTDVQIVVADVSAIVKKVSVSVVGVQTEIYSDFAQTYTGSGIILSAEGYIVTNNHVIAGGDSITIVLSDGKTYPAYLIGADEQTDVAVLKIDAKGLSPAEFGDSSNLSVGEAAIVIGSPAGLELQGSTTSGIISGINRSVTIGNNVMSLIQTDASINPGNSGGPLINKYGQVVGVTSARLTASGYEGIGFAIPINTVKPIVEQIIQNGYVSGRPLVGVSTRAISPMAAAFYSIPKGLLIDAVCPGTDAESKLKANDILVGINGQEVSALSDACKIRNAFQVGDALTLTVYRDGKRITVEVKLSEQTTAKNADYNF